MKHQTPEQLREAAAIVAASPITRMSRKDRLNRWAELLDQHGGSMEALYRIEYLPEAERRAYRGGDTTPLAVAYRDPVLRGDGLQGDTLGDAMDYFEMSDEDAHHLLCDCHYMGSLTGHNLASRLRRYAAGGGVMGWARSVFGHAG
ncbi:MAG TPA: hypothetical protein GYA10_10205 [Alphaproteobacteria bacterium]|nr:hypothetical protein [Alphaproteobacteria bacterium]